MFLYFCQKTVLKRATDNCKTFKGTSPTCLYHSTLYGYYFFKDSITGRTNGLRGRISTSQGSVIRRPFTRIDFTSLAASTLTWITLQEVRRMQWKCCSWTKTFRRDRLNWVSSRPLSVYQIGRFIGLWASLWQQLICPNLPHS